MPATKRPIASPRSELNQSMPQLILRPLCFLWRLVGFRLGARGQRLWVMDPISGFRLPFPNFLLSKFLLFRRLL